MHSIHLYNNLRLEAEKHGKKARLVLAEGEVEKACRKETASRLYSFIKSADGLIFKGRLQLHKQGSNITILFKGEPVGVISDESFINIINALD
ncbi:hypothetical protein ACFQZX_02940 [Mucilaginibacter litoreus]|uniref:Uncharacterized protein n=1 Tax=Mucilaginibacter litoreus TaxID=1048221 RepID=A0ABW3AP58_9SPHI